MEVKKPELDEPASVGSIQTRPAKPLHELIVARDTWVTLLYLGRELRVVVEDLIDHMTFIGRVEELDGEYKPLGELQWGDKIEFKRSDIRHFG